MVQSNCLELPSHLHTPDTIHKIYPHLDKPVTIVNQFLCRLVLGSVYPDPTGLAVLVDPYQPPALDQKASLHSRWSSYGHLQSLSIRQAQLSSHLSTPLQAGRLSSTNYALRTSLPTTAMPTSRPWASPGLRLTAYLVWVEAVTHGSLCYYLIDQNVTVLFLVRLSHLPSGHQHFP